jgi:hypothetical protein
MASYLRLFFLPAILAVLLAASVSHAGRLDGAATAISIPERYTLLIAVIPKGEQLSQNEEAAIKTEMEAQREKLNVAQLEVAFYVEGTRYGDGVVAYATAAKDLNPEWAFVFPEDDAHAKEIERRLGYDCLPKDLWQAFEDNEVVAEEDFKGKPVRFVGKCEGVAKDSFGKIYVNIPVDKTGYFGIRVYLKKDDPMLRQLKKGQIVALRAIPQRYVAKSVLADGEIIFIKSDK